MRIVLFANTDWYLYNFRRALALALVEQGHELILLSPAGEYGERLRQLQLDWRAVPMNRRSLNPLAEVALVFHLYRLLRRERIDLVHGFTIKSAIYGAVAGRIAGLSGRIGAIAGLGYVFTSDELRARCLRPVVRAAMRLAFAGKNARVILQNADDLNALCERRLVSAGNTRLIRGSGVDCDLFSPSPQRNSAASRVRVLFAARLLWDKGIAEFVEAGKRLRQQYPESEFLIAGEPDTGNPSAVAAELIESWSNDDGISYLGHVDDMPALYQSIDIVVLPSYREGLPKGLLEAAACGLALVATDVPGCREIVEDGVTGLLVPPRNADELRLAIEALIIDPARRATLGDAARAKVLAEFAQDRIVAETISVYRELVP